MNSKYPEDNLNEDDIATLLRGFATQINGLAKPKLYVVQRIARDIGLVVMTKEQYNVANKQKEINTILTSDIPGEEKLERIANLFKQSKPQGGKAVVNQN